MTSAPACKGSVVGDNGAPEMDAVMTAFQAYDSILFDDTIPASAKLQLLAYLRHSDRAFRGARPGAGVLMKACSTTRRQTIYQNANKLEREKRISVRRFPGCSNHVDINVDRLWTIAESIAFENPRLAKRFSWASTSAPDGTGRRRTSTLAAPETSAHSTTGSESTSAPKAPDPCAESTGTRALRAHKRDNNGYKNVERRVATASPTSARDPMKLNPYETNSDYQLDSEGLPVLLNGAWSMWLDRFGSEGELHIALAEAAKAINVRSHQPLGAVVGAELGRILRLKNEREQDRKSKASAVNQPRRTQEELADEKWRENLRRKSVGMKPARPAAGVAEFKPQ